MSEVIRVEKLGKHYQQGGKTLQVIRGLDLTVEAGQRVAIVGMSGSGKSTLLHLLAGLDEPDEGQVFINGHDIEKLSESALCELRNKYLGFIYQFHHLIGEFDARENVALPLWIRGEPKAKALQAAAEMLGKVGLAERLTHRPGELSGGERQRVAIARALVTGPRCVLADEPTGNLDEETATQVDELMVQLAGEFGVSFVVVTHNSTLAQRMDVTYRLHNGVLVP